MKLPQQYDKLTPLDRKKVREAYIIEQKGRCIYCSTSLSVRPKGGRPINLGLFPEGFLRYPVHLHHDHVSGLTIGALHAECNAESFQYSGV